MDKFRITGTAAAQGRIQINGGDSALHYMAAALLLVRYLHRLRARHPAMQLSRSVAFMMLTRR
jgi:UDP-N-acetylglucosamine enolpyruvyl transferase